MPRRKTTEEKLEMYPQEMWDIMQAASKGETWVKEFPAHNLACSFISRFYNFRYDAIEMRSKGTEYERKYGLYAGALNLKSMYVTGRDASGAIFQTKNRLAPPPITVQFVYTGAGHALQKMMEPIPGLDGVEEEKEEEKVAEANKAPDKFETLMGQYGYGAMRKEATEGGTAPGTGTGPGTGTHQHELNELTNSCVHCGKPEEEW